jgi:ABC-type uncharacterized transport system permease subunit
MSRKRNPNFKDAELQILLDEVERNKSILFSKLSNVAMFSSNTKIYVMITQIVQWIIIIP